MTKMPNRDKYLKLMNGMEIIESRSVDTCPAASWLILALTVETDFNQPGSAWSSLHSHLVEHLNAEIVLGTIRDVNMALDWIRSTFLYIRTLKNPTHYGRSWKLTSHTCELFLFKWPVFSGFSKNLDRCGIESKLQGGLQTVFFSFVQNEVQSKLVFN